MKRLFLCVALAAVMMLSGCAGMKIDRGLDAAGAFISSASPAVAVQAGEGFTAVTAGRTLCVVPIENGILPIESADVWYSLHKAENAQLAVMLAEGSTLREAAARASIASGIGVTRKYAATSIPNKEDIEKYI